MTKRSSSNPASGPTPKTWRWRAMICRASDRWSKLRRLAGSGVGNTRSNASLTMPMMDGTSVTLLIHIGRICRRAKIRKLVRPYSTPLSPRDR
jgi:hypothetical protein